MGSYKKIDIINMNIYKRLKDKEKEFKEIYLASRRNETIETATYKFMSMSFKVYSLQKYISKVYELLKYASEDSLSEFYETIVNDALKDGFVLGGNETFFDKEELYDNVSNKGETNDDWVNKAGKVMFAGLITEKVLKSVVVLLRRKNVDSELFDSEAFSYLVVIFHKRVKL